MAESILLLIILLIIIAISIGFYLYTQQNTTDDKTFSERELKIIDKATTNSQTIITNDIDTKLDDSNYVTTDDLTDDRSNIQSNLDKIAEITDLRTDLRTTGDKGYTGTTSTGTTSTGTTSTGTTSTGTTSTGDISVGSYQYIMQDITDGSDAKIELKNKVNIANDFNICKEDKSVCYKFTVDESDNLNIVKTDGDADVNGGKIYFKNAFELYDKVDAETPEKYNSGSRNLHLSVTPDQIEKATEDNQKKIFVATDWNRFETIKKIKDPSETAPNSISSFNYLKIRIGEDGSTPIGNFKYYYPYPFTKYSKLAIYNTENQDIYTVNDANQATINLSINAPATGSMQDIENSNANDILIIPTGLDQTKTVDKYKLFIYQDS